LAIALIRVHRVTPNSLNQPQTTTHRNASGTVIATTTNTYDPRDYLNGWTTTDAHRIGLSGGE